MSFWAKEKRQGIGSWSLRVKTGYLQGIEEEQETQAGTFLLGNPENNRTRGNLVNKLLLGVFLPKAKVIC